MARKIILQKNELFANFQLSDCVFFQMYSSNGLLKFYTFERITENSNEAAKIIFKLYLNSYVFYYVQKKQQQPLLTKSYTR